ncbi:MAG: PHP domain-containing protein [Alphaproteobacteria bacterium]|nr:PHP domain-containing protein [Alphaproteobacteria bacterium]
MQKFTLHTHNNELHFDGRYSAREMIKAAEDKGFTTIGVSNHMIMHHQLTPYLEREPMFFDDYNKAEKAYQRHIEILQNLKSDYKIDIKIGFEVDFFCHKKWRNHFEKMLPHLQVDYLLSGSHFLKNSDESFICNIYHLKHLNPQPDAETLHQWTINHFENIIAAINSGYFSFIAHLDYCTIFGLGEDEHYTDYKYRIMEALAKTNTPFEINTSGYDRINRPHPDIWMIKEMSKNGGIVPTLISDDAHYTEKLGRYFEQTEQLLKDLNYTNRFTLDMLKKPL